MWVKKLEMTNNWIVAYLLIDLLTDCCVFIFIFFVLIKKDVQSFSKQSLKI